MLSCDLNYIKMKHLRNLDLRKAIACLLDDFYYREGNARRCHKQVYLRFGRYLCGVNYETFMDYLANARANILKMLPPYMVFGVECMVVLGRIYFSVGCNSDIFQEVVRRIKKELQPILKEYEIEE